jgi:hypothetical protein
MLWVGPIYLVEFIGVMLATSVLLALYAAVRMAAEMDGDAAGAPTPSGVAAARQRLGAFKWVLNLRYVPLTKLNVPYGVAISAGGLTFLALTVLNP